MGFFLILFPPIVFEGFRHHFIEGIGGIGGIYIIALVNNVAINGANSVAEHINLQFLHGGEARSRSVEAGYLQGHIIRILINEIGEGVEALALQGSFEDFQIFLPIFKKMVAKIPITAAAVGLNIIIQHIFEVGVHHIVLILEVAIKGGAADPSLLHYHLHGDFMEVHACYKAVEGFYYSLESAAYHALFLP